MLIYIVIEIVLATETKTTVMMMDHPSFQMVLLPSNDSALRLPMWVYLK